MPKKLFLFFFLLLVGAGVALAQHDWLSMGIHGVVAYALFRGNAGMRKLVVQLAWLGVLLWIASAVFVVPIAALRSDGLGMALFIVSGVATLAYAATLTWLFRQDDVRDWLFRQQMQLDDDIPLPPLPRA